MVFGWTGGSRLSEEQDAFDHTMMANVGGAFRICQALVPPGGHNESLSVSFCLISSTLSRLVSTQSVAYHVSKAAAEHLVRVVSVQLPRYGLKFRANAVSPGFVVQDRHQQRFDSSENSEWRRVAVLSHPGGSVVSEFGIVEAVHWLNSDLADHVVGTVLTVDGGLSVQEQFDVALTVNADRN